MTPSGLTIGPDGYFYRDTERFIPVGANYWPASCGYDMWQAWPVTEIQNDLNLLTSLGLNCIRFFLRWEDFEPTPAQYDSAMFERLNDLLIWCGDRGLYAQPTLFTPQASGPSLGPPWKVRQNLFEDEVMRQRAVDFAFTTARVLAPHHPYLAGVDVGHHLSRLADCRSASVESIQAWCRDVTSAINGGYRDALVVSGNGIDQLTRDTGWRLNDLPGCDFLAMHASTFPHDHPVQFDGLTDPFAHTLLPLYTEIARSFGPVMVQDFGIAPMSGPKQQDAYLRAILPLCWNAGANGFLWTSLRDVPSTRAIESTFGLLDSAGNIKPGLTYFLDFAHSLPDTLRPRISPNYIGLYFPRNYYGRDAIRGSDGVTNETIGSLALANYYLRSLGHETRIVRGDRPINPRTKTIFITAGNLQHEEAYSLAAWVEAGGRLIWHGPNPLQWGGAYELLLGAELIDLRTPQDTLLKLAGQEWKIRSFPGDTRLEVNPTQAVVAAVDDSGFPLILRHMLGRGMVTCVLANVEKSILDSAHTRAERDRWRKWYHALLRD